MEELNRLNIVRVSEMPESPDAKGWRENKRIGRAQYIPETNVIRLSIYPSPTAYYEVDLDRCQNARQFTGWMLHLSQKRWMKEVFSDFMMCLECAISERYGKSALDYFNGEIG